ncbi:MAG: helix-hairpin-helix domain-containing protein [Bacteroidales bacterium]|nr:helix-hairpin-helix domain-containing protein [Bacteroidales bacterium]
MKKDRQDKPGKEDKRRRALSASFITGAVALVFLIVGYQVALFMNRAARKKLGAEHSVDTLYIMAPSETSGTESFADNAKSGGSYKKTNDKPSNVASGWRQSGNGGKSEGAGRPVESFRFDPNTASVEDLQRLGFSEKQAQSIDNYRLKGGRFRRPSDFARSYVVSDTVFARLEPYIDIPKLDLNTADSAAFTTLPGIGGYFARKMVEYREELGGYSYPEQLMDIYHFDSDKFTALEDLVFVNPDKMRPFALWTLPEDSLRLHPYIGAYAAHGVVVYRENNPSEVWTVEGLDRAGILRPGMAEKLSKCRIANNL